MTLCDKCKHKDSCNTVISPDSIIDQCPKFEFDKSGKLGYNKEGGK